MTVSTKISKDTTIEEITENHPQLIKPLKKYGIKCIACGEPVWGTIEDNAKNKGIENIDEIVVSLNNILGEE
ncbi:MAG: DUF1858 domain-containing protein [Aliifodinibius sp.]|nr:DUF1858 domain-containing protein [candidate division Zixibacteria bacterium]NIT59064.1 DUF1858 domain-containing protein [Fodinibius sp.]NIS47312.1 DUF1858 domain-containing protein [candidate division Zixibacteria bacterium]NIU15424.1 DUF1858 domain-containing protein [candidate division Zixibacteria bacterium]NIV07517.1 DUF1858 domain-containing protein [candidate division Zixibacteria bacterium]